MMRKNLRKRIIERCEKNRNNFREKGITLIALVVTVIILLILAGITISLILGNQGLLGRAQLASNTMAEATRNEKTMMDYYSGQVYEFQRYTSEDTVRITSSISQLTGKTTISLTYDSIPQGYVMQYKLGSEDEWTNYIEPLTINGSKEKIRGRLYNENLSNNNSTAESNWYIVNELSEGLFDDEISVGDTINWTPNGKYTQWKAKYYSDSDTVDKILYSGNTANIENVETTTSWETELSGNHNMDMTISNWRVLEISEDRKKITLVPAEPTAAGVKLTGAPGYNNSVKLLNDACDALYGNTLGNEDGITARSIKIEDIYDSMTETDAVASAKSEAGYGNRKTPEYPASRSRYPKIYEEEALRRINGNPSEEEGDATGIGISESANITADDNGFISRGIAKITSATSIQPVHTYYSLGNIDLAESLQYPAIGYTDKNGPFLPNGANTRSYWTASRCISIGSSFCRFSVSLVGSGCLSRCTMIYSKTGGESAQEGLFPIVSITSGMFKGMDGIYEFNPTI